MDNYDVMAGGCENCEAADREIDKLTDRLDAADRETLAAFDMDRARLTAAAALAELAELFVDDLDDRIIYPSFIGRSFTVYECRLCGGENRTPADIEHAHDCIYARTRKALREYQEATNGS